MDYKEKVVEVLEKNMSERGFKLWSHIDGMLPDIWEKPTSSTGKHHKKLNGEVPNQAEHIYHIVYSTAKIMRLFSIEPNTTDADKMLFAAVLHDALKYGDKGTNKHTTRDHDAQAAEMLLENKNVLTKLFSEEQFAVVEEAVRYHSGQWSTSIPKGQEFSFKDYNPESLFLHMLDMMSTADLIQTDIRE